jgi:hypothetical protein
MISYVVADTEEMAAQFFQENLDTPDAKEAEQQARDVEEETGHPQHIYRVTIEQFTP